MGIVQQLLDQIRHIETLVGGNIIKGECSHQVDTGIDKKGFSSSFSIYGPAV
jgi:hypothetical protein